MADERESKELQSGTLVIGLGRFGAAVAVTQDQLGYEILAVEKNPARVQAFAGRFPLVEADATSKDALEQLGAREFRSAVVGVARPWRQLSSSPRTSLTWVFRRSG